MKWTQKIRYTYGTACHEGSMFSFARNKKKKKKKNRNCIHLSAESKSAVHVHGMSTRVAARANCGRAIVPP